MNLRVIEALSPSHSGSTDHEDVRGINERPDLVEPGIRWSAVLTHIGIDAGGDVVVDEADAVDRGTLGVHQRDVTLAHPR